MYAVLRRNALLRGSMSEAVREIHEHFLPRLQQISGFVSYELVVESDTAFTSISVFDTESGARDSTRLVGDFTRELVDRFTFEPREMVEGAVLIHQEATIGAGR